MLGRGAPAGGTPAFVLPRLRKAFLDEGKTLPGAGRGKALWPENAIHIPVYAGSL